MCGFVGYFGKKKFSLNSPLEEILHRGPDSKTIYNGEDYGIGFCRLSILDLKERSMQPIIFKNIIIFFNGEIYNYLELINEHKNEFSPKTKSDGEIIPFLFYKYGIDFLNKINGMFSIVLINVANGEKYLIRDRFGKKPLYYLSNKNSIFFSSEIKALKKIIPIEISKINLAINLTCWNQITPLTNYKDVLSVNPGSYLKISNGIIKEKKWYYPKKIEIYDFNEQFMATFENSVKLRLRSDVPIGVFLSGGLDSISIADSILRNKNINCQYFTSFNTEKVLQEKNSTDTKIPKTFAIENNLNLNTHELNFNFWDENIFKIVNNYETVFMDMGNLVFYQLSEAANKKNIKVIISGQGGDEFLGGYPWQSDLVNSKFLELQLKIKIEKSINKIFKYFNKKNKFTNKILNRIRMHFQPLIWFSRSFSNGFQYEIEDIALEVENKIFDYSKLFFENELDKFNDKSNLINYLNIYTVLGQSNQDIDLACMNSSIENRSPYQDYNLVELLCSTSHKKKIINGHKSLARSIFSQRLPNYVIQAKKSGPTPYLESWLEQIDKKNLNNFFKQNSDLVSEYCSEKLGNKLKTRNTFNPGMTFAVISLILFIKKNVKNDFDQNINFKNYIK